MEHWCNDTNTEKPKYRHKTRFLFHFLHISHGFTGTRTRASAVLRMFLWTLAIPYVATRCRNTEDHNTESELTPCQI